MTPTSGTGTDRIRRSGFSLIELMVVVALIGLMATAAALTLPDPRGRLEDEAARLAARLALARDEAVLTGRATAVRLDVDGYGFLTRHEGQWTPLSQTPFRRTAWRGDARPVLPPSGAQVVAFDPLGLTEPTQVRLVREGRATEIVVTASGEVRRND